MTVRPVSTGSISFGLVSIPVKLFSAIRRRTVSFNLLHAKDLSRIQQQIYCPVDNATVSRSELVRGVQVEKGRYVTFSDEELKALEAADNGQAIEITEFLPIEQVDPLYFEESYYLGVDGSAKAYRLLADAMAQSRRVALGRFTMHGKEHVVMLRPFRQGLMLHTIYYADEVRPLEEVDQAPHEQAREAELELAKRLIEGLTEKHFDPTKYHDSYRERVMAAARQKLGGEEPAERAPKPKRGQVIDLMAALRASLEARGTAARAPQPEQALTVHEERAASRKRTRSSGSTRNGSKDPKTNVR